MARSAALTWRSAERAAIRASCASRLPATSLSGTKLRVCKIKQPLALARPSTFRCNMSLLFQEAQPCRMGCLPPGGQILSFILVITIIAIALARDVPSFKMLPRVVGTGHRKSVCTPKVVTRPIKVAHKSCSAQVMRGPNPAGRAARLCPSYVICGSISRHCVSVTHMQ